MLLIETPDIWIAELAQQLSAQHLKFNQIEGGLIAGSAEVSWQDGFASPRSLGRWEWRLTPRWDGLFTESLNALSGPATGHTALQFSWEGIALHQSHFIIQVKSIQLNHPLWSMMQPSAELHLEAEKITIHDEAIRGEATITCLHGYSPQVRLPDLGSWQIQLHADGDIGSAKFSTLQGPLHVEGEGRFTTQPFQMKLSGRLWSEAREARDIEPIIKPLGIQERDGSVPWKLQF